MDNIKRNFDKGGMFEEGFISPKDPGLLCKKVVYSYLQILPPQDYHTWVRADEIQKDATEDCFWKLRQPPWDGKKAE